MKHANFLQCISLALIVALTSCSAGSNSIQSGVTGTVSYQTFYDNLAPYGTGIDYPSYGHVWAPRLDEDFRPYASNGNWTYTIEGWTWVSDYAWGWSPSVQKLKPLPFTS